MLLEGKKAVIFGVANNRSIAWGIAQALKAQGARLAFSYMGDAIKKRLEPLSAEIGGEFLFPCDVSKDEDLQSAADIVKEKWGDVDILVHSVAFANRDDLRNDFITTSREGFHLALDISSYSLLGMCRAFDPLLHEDSSVMAMTFYGSTKICPGYNVMGVAKAALEATMRYLAYDMGKKGVRVNCISAGPVKTLASSAVSSMKNVGQLVQDQSPLHRNIETKDVGGCAVYLGSDLSRSVTGQCLFVDCGISQIGC